MNKAEFQILKKALEQIEKPKEESIFSYFMDNESCYDFIDSIGNYLFKTYSIDKKYNSWIEQIDHYSYLKECDWVNGFYTLLDEMDEYHDFLSKTAQEEVDLSFEAVTIDKTKSVKELKINDEFEIKVGDLIELSDLIGNDYRQTKYYDASIKNPSWELFYSSKQDFKYVKFYHEDSKNDLSPVTIGRVWRIFSRLENTVLSIIERDGKYFIYTEIFEIEIEKALKEKECTISNAKELPKNIHSIIDQFTDWIELYRLGFVTKDNLLEGFPIFYFDNFRKEWQRYGIHFMSTIGRRWLPW